MYTYDWGLGFRGLGFRGLGGAFGEFWEELGGLFWGLRLLINVTEQCNYNFNHM